MKSAPLPINEEERLRSLQALQILDTLEEQAYDDLTLLAAQICETPIALVSLVDRDRQWFKSHFGLEAKETPRELAFCAHAILGDVTFEITDSDKDERFFDNPLVTGAPHVKFYAGAPLVLRNNVRLGTLCVIDSQPRKMSESQKTALSALARQVVSQLELRLKVRELEGLDKAKDEFISMVSHELRTPLTSIRGSLVLLEHQFAPQMERPVANLIGLAHRNSERLLAIVNDILDVTKLESGKLQLNTQRLDVADLVKRAVEYNQAYCEKCKVKIALRPEIASAGVFVQGDEQRLQQVLSNLISNAAKFTTDNDVIELAVRQETSGVRISITDHGPGIVPEFHSAIFKRFSHSATSDNGKLPGTGLGLNICKHLVELHNGSIGFESFPGDHTTFYFSLPYADECEAV